MRLQIETRMGSRLMEYVWPERRRRKQVSDSPTTPAPSRQRRITEAVMDSRPPPGGRASMEAPRSAEGGKSFDVARLAVPQLRRNGTSRSFTDLRSASRDQRERAPDLARNMSSYAFPMVPTPSGESQQNGSALDKERARGEADEMKSRSAQKTFVDVRIERSAISRLDDEMLAEPHGQFGPPSQRLEGKLVRLSRCANTYTCTGVEEPNV
jgi:hypothetical protein